MRAFVLLIRIVFKRTLVHRSLHCHSDVLLGRKVDLFYLGDGFAIQLSIALLLLYWVSSDRLFRCLRYRLAPLKRQVKSDMTLVPLLYLLLTDH